MTVPPAPESCPRCGATDCVAPAPTKRRTMGSGDAFRERVASVRVPESSLLATSGRWSGEFGDAPTEPAPPCVDTAEEIADYNALVEALFADGDAPPSREPAVAVPWSGADTAPACAAWLHDDTADEAHRQAWASGSELGCAL